MHGFFKGIPRDLDEAAYIDGASKCDHGLPGRQEVRDQQGRHRRFCHRKDDIDKGSPFAGAVNISLWTVSVTGEGKGLHNKAGGVL